MANDVIPDNIKQFVLKNIDSIAELEGLLMLRSHPQKEWTMEMLARSLYIGEPQAMLLLARLLEQGFIVVKGSDAAPRYQYQPKSAEWRDRVEQLAELYKKYLVPITNLIHSKPKSRVQKFADAFRLRKD